MGSAPENRDPRGDPLYRAILSVLAASVLVGAVVTLTGEALFDSRALASAGLGMAVICGVLYWVFRYLGKRAAARDQARGDAQQRDGEDR